MSLVHVAWFVKFFIGLQLLWRWSQGLFIFHYLSWKMYILIMLCILLSSLLISSYLFWRKLQFHALSKAQWAYSWLQVMWLDKQDKRITFTSAFKGTENEKYLLLDMSHFELLMREKCKLQLTSSKANGKVQSINWADCCWTVHLDANTKTGTSCIAV